MNHCSISRKKEQRGDSIEGRRIERGDGEKEKKREKENRERRREKRGN